MKNDVVRWSNNNNNTDNNNTRIQYHATIGNELLLARKSCGNKCQQHVAIDIATQQTQSKTIATKTTQQTISSNNNNNKNNNSNCDKRNFHKISFLTNELTTHKQIRCNNNNNNYSQRITNKNNNNNSRCRKRASTSLSTLNCIAVSKCLKMPPRNVLLMFLQLSVVVFLCNLNVGFVAYASDVATTTTITKLSPSSSSSSNLVLDYELPTSAVAEDANGSSGQQQQQQQHYTHTWAVHIPNGDENGRADDVARDHGFVNLGKIFDDHYHFAHHKVSKRSLAPATHHQTRLDDDERVNWAKQQTAKSRRKRDFIRMRPSRTSSRATSHILEAVPFDDPKWPHMWYLNRGNGLDMNVIPAWKQGITGKGVVVTILDDGLESDHPDIEKNYDPKASYDVNSHDDDPMPHYDMTDSNRHGTRCAGEVAATANNSICAVGIAYGASVGGVRMLDGDVTDAVEARSLSLNPQHIDIYSASWGPDDDGKTVDGPGELASRAFIEGTTKGRNGKGSIFIWASGNGGREMDNCNCDGYTNSIWTLSISSATEDGHVPWYSEKCSSTLATTYSSGGQSEKQVVTTDLHHSCTVSHTGTSASAPLAAGIAALVLESNQNLTWRDLQHIVVRTAKPANLRDTSWSKNGVGRRVSHSFGYGLMDAAEMVRVARSWRMVPEQQRCEINAPHVDKVIPPRTHITLQLSVKHCLSVNYLEHVQAKITLTSQRRGDIQLYLKSPAGTKVTLLTSRMHDISRSGFNQWPFMSVHTWGESPHGDWQLEIHNEGRYMAQITQWDLIFYGTEAPAQPDDPEHLNTRQFSLYGNDMEHNDIDADASGQWRNLQQVGESGVIRDHSNTAACLKWSDQRCLACTHSTYMYDDLCFDECPMHTYPLPIITSNNPALPATNDEWDNHIGTGYSELVAQDRRRRRNADNSAEITTHAFDTSVTSPSLSDDDNTPTSKSCATCDKSCLSCHGPSAGECSSCFPGSQLRKMPHLNESHCFVYAVRSSGNISEIYDGHETQADTADTSKLNFLTLILPVVTISALAGFALYRRHQTISGSDTYSRVSLLPDADSDDDYAYGDDEHEEGEEEDELFSAQKLHAEKSGAIVTALEYHDELQKVPLTVTDDAHVSQMAATSELETEERTKHSIV